MTAVGGTAVGTSRPPAAANRDASGATRPQSSSVPGTCTGPVDLPKGVRAGAFSRQSGHFRETHRRGTGSHRLVGGTVSGRGRRGAAPPVRWTVTWRQVYSTRTGEAVGCGELDVPNASVSGGARCPPGRPIRADNAGDQLNTSIFRQPAHRPRAAVPPTPLRYGPGRDQRGRIGAGSAGRQ